MREERGGRASDGSRSELEQKRARSSRGVTSYSETCSDWLMSWARAVQEEEGGRFIDKTCKK